MISDYFKLALKNLRKRRLRSWMTMVGIIISIATIFLLISLSLGLRGAVEEQFRLLGTDKFFIQPRGQLAGPGTGGATQFTQADFDVVKKTIGVQEASPWTASPSKIEFGDQIRYVTTVGLDLGTSDLFMETGAYKAEEGRVLKRGDEGSVMIGSQYKHNNLFKKPVRVGDTILVNDREFRVRGILMPIGNPGDDRLIYMPFEDFRPLFNITERIDTIVVQVNDEKQLLEVAERMEKKLRTSRDLTEKTQDFYILTPDQLLESFGSILGIITAFLIGVAAISLLVGGIGIANTMYTSVLERTKEIGVMKSVGAKNRDITLIFLIESGLLGLVGGIIGVVFGIGIGLVIEYIAINQLGTTLLQVSTPFWLIFVCLVFAFLAGAVSGTLPAMRAANINPTEALRYE